MSTSITGIGVVYNDGTEQTTAFKAVSVTADKMSGAQTGSAPIYGARAWCVFNGNTAGTNAPLAGGNVPTVLKNSTGNYTVNFTTAMQDANYSAVVSSNGGQAYLGALTTAYVQVLCVAPSSGTPVDTDRITVTVFR